MTDDPEKVQQNVDSTEKIKQTPASKAARFKPGYDPRRWVKGRGAKSPEQKEGEEILRAVIWRELSREFDPVTGKPITPEDEPITALELAVRKEIKAKFDNIAQRIAGKVTDKVDLTSNGKDLTIKIVKASDAISDK